MDASIIVALVALAGSIFSTVLTAFGSPAFEARRQAGMVLETYREPLLSASYELQARLYNILHNSFVETWINGELPDKRDPAIDSTLYMFAQFFAWREIIRKRFSTCASPELSRRGRSRACAATSRRRSWSRATTLSSWSAASSSAESASA